MNLKNWSKLHTYGLIVGIILPLVMVPVVMLILSWVQNYSFARIWYEFKNSQNTMSKLVTLAVLANLGVFYIFLNKEKYNFAMGIILGSILYLPLIVYLIFF